MDTRWAGTSFFVCFMNGDTAEAIEIAQDETNDHGAINHMVAEKLSIPVNDVSEQDLWDSVMARDKAHALQIFRGDRVVAPTGAGFEPS